MYLGGTGAQITNTAITAGGQAATAIGIAQGAAWVPLVGPIVAGVALAVGLLLNRKGPRQKVETTKIVDQLEPLLKQNVEGYLAGPRTRTSQAAALKTFDDAWAWLTSADGCGNPEMGEPGDRCISDRQQGSCKWNDAAGSCWNWFKGYRDPIATDPDVKPDPTPTTDPAGWLAEATGGAFNPASVPAWIWPAALIGLAAMI